MSKKILLFLSFLIVLQTGFGQGFGQDFAACGLTKTDADIITKRLLRNKAKINNGFVKPRATTFVPMLFQLVSTNAGTGRANFRSVLGQMNRINNDYKDQDIQFFMAGNVGDNYVKEINNTKLFDKPSSLGSTNTMIIKKKNGRLNVFVCKSAQGSNSLGTTLGYYTSTYDWIVMRKDQTNSSSSTLSHEAGHLFSLQHPFFGWDHEVYEKNKHGNPVIETAPGGVLVENQDRSGSCKNCDKAGDMVCDTPPDYNFGFTWGNCRPYDAGTMDPCGTVVDPMENNFMGYFEECDDYAFTPDQKALMAADLDTRKQKGSVDPNLVPEVSGFVPTDVATEILTPVDTQVLGRYGNVDLTWEPVDNAIAYYLEIATRVDFGKDYEIFHVRTNAKHFAELKPNKKYYWRVTAYNQQSSNVGTNDKKTFTTGAELVADIDIDEVNFFNVVPNPSKVGEAVHISLNTSKSFNGDIHVYDITGRLLIQQKQAFNAGKNKINLNTSAFNSGLYFLKIQSKDGTINEKIVIQ